jgi:hypothetical protein
MLEALGVRTSKTFSVIETGEPLERNDEPSPTRSAVLVRLQHSHIRIGTFQRLAYHEQADEIAALTNYCLRHYYADEDGGPGAGGRLLARFATQAARLAASYIAAGFVHGGAQHGQYRNHGRELRLRPVALDPLLGTVASPPLISTMPASMPSAASRKRSAGT